MTEIVAPSVQLQAEPAADCLWAESHIPAPIYRLIQLMDLQL